MGRTTGVWSIWKILFAALLGTAALIAAMIVVVLAGRLSVRSQVPKWIHDLQDDDPAVRRGAALWLNELGPNTDEVMEALIIAMQDETVGVRQQAAHALGKFGPEAKKAIPALEQGLSDEDPYVRRYAEESLKYIDPRRAKESSP
jgi:HEAT repeat protein